MKKFIIAGLLFAGIVTGNAFAQKVSYQTQRNYYEPDRIPREHPVDMIKMRVNLSFVPRKGQVNGVVTHIFKPLRPKVDSIYFDGPGIKIKEATLNGQAVRYSVSSSGITVFPNPALHWDETDSIRFVYEAHPWRGLFFIGWNDPKGIRRKQIWSQGQGNDNRRWIPMYESQNDKMLTETIVTFDKNYQVLSNGKLVSVKDNGNGTKTWHYAISKPHASYLVMLGIGKYGIKNEKTEAGVPLHLYYYPDEANRVEPTYKYAARMVDFIANETGVPYPWSSYSQIPVEDFLYGAMENTTATVFGDFYYVDKRAFLDKNYINVNAHELAHQWFGDDITGRNPQSSWLHESFATYYAKLFESSIYGDNYHEWERRKEQNAALRASENNLLPIVHTQSGSARIYQKGSAVLDMMVYTFGEPEFKRVVHYYLNKHAFQNVESNDFYLAFQDVLGLTPHWFFEEWLYRGGEPEYSVSYRNVLPYGQSNRETIIHVEQTQKLDELTGLFKMPIVFEVHYTDGTFDSKRQWIEKQTGEVIIPNEKNKKISYVLFDPGSYILKKVDFHKSLDELKAQALHARHMIDRYDAVVAMRPYPADMKRKALIKLYGEEPYYAVRAEIAGQLANDRSSHDFVLKTLTDKNRNVRLSTLQNIHSIGRKDLSHFEKLLQDSSYTIVYTALSKLTEKYPSNTKRYLRMTKGTVGIGRMVKVKWLEISAKKGNRKSLRQLVDYVSNTYEFRTRINAIQALQRLNHLDKQLILNMFDAMTSPNHRLSGPVREVFEYFYTQDKYKDLIKKTYKTADLKDWQRKMLSGVIV